MQKTAKVRLGDKRQQRQASSSKQIMGPPAAKRTFKPSHGDGEAYVDQLSLNRKGAVDRQVRAERLGFVQTLHAIEAGDGSLFSKHVRRSPSVLWRTSETLALHALGRHVSAALVSNGLPKPDLDAKGADPSRALCYAPPTWEILLKRSQKGCGCAHARPPKGVRKDFLTAAQARILEEQNGTARNLPHRTRSLVRNLRKKNRKGFTVEQFMTGIEDQVGLRLVHVAAVRSESSQQSSSLSRHNGPATAELRLCYALDVGGRFFVALFWKVHCTDLTSCWSRGWIDSSQSLCQFQYACACASS